MKNSGLKLYDNVQTNLNFNKKNLATKNNIIKKKVQVFSLQGSKLNSKSEKLAKVEVFNSNNNQPKPKNESIRESISEYNPYNPPIKKPDPLNFNKKHISAANSPNHFPFNISKDGKSIPTQGNNASYLSNLNPNINNTNSILNPNINSLIGSSKVSNSVSSVKGKEDQKIISLKTKTFMEHKKEVGKNNPLNISNESILSTVRESNYYKSQAELLINYIKACKIV